MEWALHHGLFFAGFAEDAYGQAVLVVCGVAWQRNLQSHSLVGLLPRLEQVHVVTHRHLGNKEPIYFSAAGKGQIQYTVTDNTLL